jgi:hypothetical protein
MNDIPRNERGNLQTTSFYLSQHKDNGPNEYDVIKNVSEWVNGWPRDIERTAVLSKLDKEAAQTAVRVFNAKLGTRQNDTVAKQVKFIINFLMDNDTNRNTAEMVCPYPDVY